MISLEDDLLVHDDEARYHMLLMNHVVLQRLNTANELEV